MGLLDSVLGSVLAGQNQQSGGLGGLGNVLGGMLGGQQAQQQGPGGVNMGMVAALAPILMSMLANNSQQGGWAACWISSRAPAPAMRRSRGLAEAPTSRSAPIRSRRRWART